ncbi:hypothetical protein SISSUDRAFT_1067791 [Sistotremastrum suecicum HHB10207 ss-3]|uniref:Uncharacterized protein n=1 Tax=Sistotremastrum suecicum HHB10207 ss-3 TaxID=1314776 RepID=A0A165WPH1_9AGAM|nr:hypothetical protein SISSUDRAFT_1067791 [Sistotremastrum suecicum HHB10207 ss-3]
MGFDIFSDGPTTHHTRPTIKSTSSNDALRSFQLTPPIPHSFTRQSLIMPANPHPRSARHEANIARARVAAAAAAARAKRSLRRKFVRALLHERVRYTNTMRFRTRSWNKRKGLPMWPLFHPLENLQTTVEAIRDFVLEYNTRVQPDDALPVSDDPDVYDLIAMC